MVSVSNVTGLNANLHVLTVDLFFTGKFMEYDLDNSGDIGIRYNNYIIKFNCKDKVQCIFD